MVRVPRSCGLAGLSGTIDFLNSRGPSMHTSARTFAPCAWVAGLRSMDHGPLFHVKQGARAFDPLIKMMDRGPSIDFHDSGHEKAPGLSVRGARAFDARAGLGVGVPVPFDAQPHPLPLDDDRAVAAECGQDPASELQERFGHGSPGICPGKSLLLCFGDPNHGCAPLQAKRRAVGPCALMTIEARALALVPPHARQSAHDVL